MKKVTHGNVGDIIYPAYNGTSGFWKTPRWDIVTNINKDGLIIGRTCIWDYNAVRAIQTIRSFKPGVKIELLDENCKPIRANEGDSGMDLKSSINTMLPPKSRMLIPVGIKTEIPIGYEAQIRPRSGLALKKGITVLNTPGTVDSCFRGEIGVILFNTTDYQIEINKYDRIAQIVFNKIEIPEIIYGPVNETKRGEGGFGSTGTK